MRMNGSIDNQAVCAVLTYCELQRHLVTTFVRLMGCHSPQELCLVPRRGQMDHLGEIWSYTRHGVGVCFEREGVVVDAHFEMFRFPSAVDAWRLLEYFESIGTSIIALRNQEYSVSDTDRLDALLDLLTALGVLERIVLDPPRQMYQPRTVRSCL